MLFDALCGLVEHHKRSQIFPSDFWTLLRDAKLFHWPNQAHNLPFEELQGEEPGKLGDEFFLPFPVIAVEDPWSVILLEDPESETIGITRPRFFIECSTEDPARREKLHPSQQSPGVTPVYPPGIFTVKWGFVSNIRLLEECSYYIETNVEGYFVGNKDKVIVRGLPSDSTYHTAIHRMANENLLAALSEIALFNVPSRFVVKVQRANGKHRPPGSWLSSSSKDSAKCGSPDLHPAQSEGDRSHFPATGKGRRT